MSIDLRSRLLPRVFLKLDEEVYYLSSELLSLPLVPYIKLGSETKVFNSEEDLLSFRCWLRSEKTS